MDARRRDGEASGEVVAEGAAWTLRRTAEDEHVLVVVPSRHGWRRWLPLLVWPAIAVGGILLFPRSYPGFIAFLAVMNLRPHVTWAARARETVTIGRRYVSVSVRSLWSRVNETMERPPEGTLDIARSGGPSLLLPGLPAAAFRGGGRVLSFGRGLAEDDAQALVRALAHYAPLWLVGPVRPGAPGVPRRVAFRRESADGRQRGIPYGTKRPLRVGVSPATVGACAVAAVAALIAGSKAAFEPGDVSTSVLVFVAALVFLAWAAPGGLRTRIRRALLERRRVAFPAEPWRWSGDGDRERDVRDPFSRLARRRDTYLLVGAIAFAVFRPGGAFAEWWGLAVLVSASCGFRVWNVAFAGESEVRWEGPAGPGERLTARFATSREAATFRSITFQLRRYQERPDPGWPLANEVVCMREATYLLPEDVPPPSGGEEVEARFDLPEDAASTDLLCALPTWWELEVSGDTSCGPYSERFRAPVFTRPSDG